ncbi:hypothetical protein SUGI_0408330 [Cryptomeria japonica]|nr:hypothetical protein SUGI_0408330 [Cryptomeria japonica]
MQKSLSDAMSTQLQQDMQSLLQSLKGKLQEELNSMLRLKEMQGKRKEKWFETKLQERIQELMHLQQELQTQKANSEKELVAVQTQANIEKEAKEKVESNLQGKDQELAQGKNSLILWIC